MIETEKPRAHGITKQDSMWFRNIQLSKPGSRILFSQTIGHPKHRIRECSSAPLEIVHDRRKIDIGNGVRRAFEASIEVRERISIHFMNHLWDKEEKLRAWRNRNMIEEIKNKQVVIHDDGIIEKVKENWCNGIRLPKLKPEKSTHISGVSQIYYSTN